MQRAGRAYSNRTAEQVQTRHGVVSRTFAPVAGMAGGICGRTERERTENGHVGVRRRGKRQNQVSKTGRTEKPAKAGRYNKRCEEPSGYYKGSVYGEPVKVVQ